jgi:chromosome segregation ATPase
MTTADRTAGLRAARAKDSTDKRRRAREAIDALEAAGTPVTAAAVADTAGVSTWLVYADGLREHLDQARRRQALPAPGHTRTQAAQAPATPASLRTDLALARDQIRQLRADNDKLRKRLRLQLGAEIDGPSRAELTGRVADLENLNRQLLAERDARTAETHDVQRRIRDLEDDLTAARESLRRVIKHNNRPSSPPGPA